MGVNTPVGPEYGTNFLLINTLAYAQHSDDVNKAVGALFILENLSEITQKICEPIELRDIDWRYQHVPIVNLIKQTTPKARY